MVLGLGDMLFLRRHLLLVLISLANEIIVNQTKMMFNLINIINPNNNNNNNKNKP